MKINCVKYLKGPNYFTYSPSIFIECDIGELEYRPSDSIPGFTETLLKLLPGLKKHTCSPGYEGGFAERLASGTWMGHILEHMAIEIQVSAGIDVKRGKTLTGNQPGIYYITYSYKEEKSGLFAFEAAVEIIKSILADEKNIPVNGYIEKTADLFYKNKLGPSTEAIYEAALAAKIPVQRVGTESMLRLGTGSRQKFMQATISSQTSNIAVETSCNKQLTKETLQACGIPVPQGEVVSSMSEIFHTADRLGFPLVIKPLNGRQGQGVITNIKNRDELFNVVNCLDKHEDTYILERYFEGNDYRLLVVDDKLAAASMRTAPFIIGNGKDSIRNLIEEENLNPLRGDGHEKPMSKIPLNHSVSCYLEKFDLTLESIPEKGKIIAVAGNANLSTGGRASDVTDQVHPSIAKMAISAARAIGLDIAGIDLICKDISKPVNINKMAIIEINAAPGIRMHLYPSEGKMRDVGKTIVDYLFPDRREAAIPIISVTGTNGKTTTARLVHHFLSKEGIAVGMANSDGVFIGQQCLHQGDCSGPISARQVLNHPMADFAVLETARGGILREGLAFRNCEVGIVTNVAEDHLGSDAIDTFEQLVKLKRLIPEVVHEEGYCILNADDEQVAKMAPYSKGEIIYTSIHEHSRYIQNAIKNGKKAWFLNHDSRVVYHDGNELIMFLDCRDIPITINGSAKHNISNVLQALAAAHSQGISLHELRKKAKSFIPDSVLSKGRFNYQEIRGRKVLVDYAHNTAGLKAIFDTIAVFDKKRVISVIAGPGDRKDEDLKKMAKITADHSDIFIIKEDDDLRGRKPFEVASILKETALECSMEENQTLIVPKELEAFKKAWEISVPGDMLLLFYTDFAYVKEFLQGTMKQSSYKR
ncbi:cyanophycin synthetase [Bacillus sp. OV322]|uniref:cyanophycin synthetase n=1 Tax=Bacillus sp. OV322 TaxID=1882764 RepID=UPI0008ED41B6|nr:cyanophycin synthetase [Bacillus sp. OV322]SFC01776.1 cyanophycin synthetase [Bacillus sp. OV322]